MIVQLLADWPLGSQVLVVRPGLRLLHVLLLPLLHGGLVGLLVVRDGLDDVLPPAGDRREVAPDLTLVRHGGGGQAQLTGSSVHAGVLLLTAVIVIKFSSHLILVNDNNCQLGVSCVSLSV